eukprot:4016717-Alexandrium_andersonii.AAC.1
MAQHPPRKRWRGAIIGALGNLDQGPPREPARRSRSGSAPAPNATRGSPKGALRPSRAGGAGCYPCFGAGYVEPA